MPTPTLPAARRIIRRPCCEEVIYNARQTVRDPKASGEQLHNALLTLERSQDWQDRDLARQLREAKIANDRIAAQERERRKSEAALLFSTDVEADLPPLVTKRQAIGIAVIVAAMIALFVTAGVKAHTAATTQAIEWRASL